VRWSPIGTYDRRPERVVPIATQMGAGGILLGMMTRRLARKNLRTAMIVFAICMFMFGITFVVAAAYVS
jgi:hypothetical protein